MAQPVQQHPAQARLMGEAGRQRVLRLFTWPAVVGRCLDAYQGDVRQVAA